MANLIRFSPTNDLLRLQREIDQMFNSFFPARSSDNTAESENAVWTPRVDFAETEDAYLVWLDVPGVTKEDVEINYHDGALTVSGERKPYEQDKTNFVRLERIYGRFFRSFTLPKAIDADRIEAAYQDGVLSLRVPKAEESKPRRITIS